MWSASAVVQVAAAAAAAMAAVATSRATACAGVVHCTVSIKKEGGAFDGLRLSAPLAFDVSPASAGSETMTSAITDFSAATLGGIIGTDRKPRILAQRLAGRFIIPLSSVLGAAASLMEAAAAAADPVGSPAGSTRDSDADAWSPSNADVVVD
jgi:hypothetical protein